jgi:hypothetical protein
LDRLEGSLSQAGEPAIPLRVGLRFAFAVLSQILLGLIKPRVLGGRVPEQQPEHDRKNGSHRRTTYSRQKPLTPAGTATTIDHKMAAIGMTMRGPRRSPIRPPGN